MMTDSSIRKYDAERVKGSLATKRKKMKKKLYKNVAEACIIAQEGVKYKRKKKKKRSKQKRSKKIREEVILQRSEDSIKDWAESESQAVDDHESIFNRPTVDCRHENEIPRMLETDESEREAPQLYEEGDEIISEKLIGNTGMIAVGKSVGVDDDELESLQSTKVVMSAPNTEHKATETAMNILLEGSAVNPRNEDSYVSSNVHLGDELGETSNEEESDSTISKNDIANASTHLKDPTLMSQHSIQTVTHTILKEMSDTKTKHQMWDYTLSDDETCFSFTVSPEESFGTHTKIRKPNQDDEADDGYIDFDPSEVQNEHALLDDISILVLQVQEIQQEEWLVEKKVPRIKPKRRFKLSLKRIEKSVRFLRSRKHKQEKSSFNIASNLTDILREGAPVSVLSDRATQIPRQKAGCQFDTSSGNNEVNNAFPISKTVSVQAIVYDTETTLECSIQDDDYDEDVNYNSIIVYENTQDAREFSRPHDTFLKEEEEEEERHTKSCSSNDVLNDSYTFFIGIGNQIKLCDNGLLMLHQFDKQAGYCRLVTDEAIEDFRGLKEIQYDLSLPSSIVLAREGKIEQVLLPEKEEAPKGKQSSRVMVPFLVMAKLLSRASLKNAVKTETCLPARRIKQNIEKTDHKHFMDSKKPSGVFLREETSFGVDISDCVGIEACLLSDAIAAMPHADHVKDEEASVIFKLLDGGPSKNSLCLLHNKFNSESPTTRPSALARRQPFKLGAESSHGVMDIELCVSEDNAEIELCLSEGIFEKNATFMGSRKSMEKHDDPRLFFGNEAIEVELCEHTNENDAVSPTAQIATSIVSPFSERELQLSATVGKGKRRKFEMSSKCQRRAAPNKDHSTPNTDPPESSEELAMLKSTDNRKRKLHFTAPSKKHRKIEKDRVNESNSVKLDTIELCSGATSIEVCLSKSKLSPSFTNANGTSVLCFSTGKEQPDVFHRPLDGGDATEIELCQHLDKVRVTSVPMFGDLHSFLRPANREKTWPFCKYLQRDKSEKETIFDSIFSIVEDIELCTRIKDSTPSSHKKMTKLPKAKPRKCETIALKCEETFSLEGSTPISGVNGDAKDVGDIKAVELCLLTDEFASDARKETVRLLVTHFDNADHLQNEDESRFPEKKMEPEVDIVLSDVGISRDVELCLKQDEFVPMSRQPIQTNFEAFVLREITNALDTRVSCEACSLSSLSSSYDGSDLSSSSESSFGSSIGQSFEETTLGGDHGLYHALNTFSELMSIPSPLSNPEDDWTNYSEIQSMTKPPKILECKIYNNDTFIESKSLKGGAEGIASNFISQTIGNLALSLKDQEAQIKSQNLEIESLKGQLRTAQLERSHFEKKALEIEHLLIKHENAIRKLSSQVSAL